MSQRGFPREGGCVSSRRSTMPGLNLTGVSLSLLLLLLCSPPVVSSQGTPRGGAGGGGGGGGGAAAGGGGGARRGAERIKVLFTPTICKVRCAQGRCTNFCERGNITTLYNSQRPAPGHGFRVCEYPPASVCVCVCACVRVCVCVCVCVRACVSTVNACT